MSTDVASQAITTPITKKSILTASTLKEAKIAADQKNYSQWIQHLDSGVTTLSEIRGHFNFASEFNLFKDGQKETVQKNIDILTNNLLQHLDAAFLTLLSTFVQNRSTTFSDTIDTTRLIPCPHQTIIDLSILLRGYVELDKVSRCATLVETRVVTPLLQNLVDSFVAQHPENTPSVSMFHVYLVHLCSSFRYFIVPIIHAFTCVLSDDPDCSADQLALHLLNSSYTVPHVLPTKHLPLLITSSCLPFYHGTRIDTYSASFVLPKRQVSFLKYEMLAVRSIQRTATLVTEGTTFFDEEWVSTLSLASFWHSKLPSTLPPSSPENPSDFFIPSLVPSHLTFHSCPTTHDSLHGFIQSWNVSFLAEMLVTDLKTQFQSKQLSSPNTPFVSSPSPALRTDEGRSALVFIQHLFHTDMLFPLSLHTTLAMLNWLFDALMNALTADTDRVALEEDLTAIRDVLVGSVLPLLHTTTNTPPRLLDDTSVLLNSVNAVPTSDCMNGTGIVSVDRLLFNQEPIRRGTNSTATLTYTVHKDLESADCEGILLLGKVPIVKIPFSMCFTDRCPFKPGTYQDSVVQEVPSFSPKGTFSGQVKCYDPKKTQVLCTDIKVTITD
ncbi:hypothetical protein BLNAU_8776 [Blattamonas nauphoetae]|uniref:MD-2-related lipid-recognition domain-containing protein n=1 Tax=Blattamonas nauphoetae TaxID=2049346 RepID=A0ABQ9XXL9_9EUKA|nr:hypothetical protein BLNAU_8776 [Blattamonas nauphoetae]